jgi:hypothetical protein
MHYRSKKKLEYLTNEYSPDIQDLTCVSSIGKRQRRNGRHLRHAKKYYLVDGAYEFFGNLLVSTGSTNPAKDEHLHEESHFGYNTDEISEKHPLRKRIPIHQLPFREAQESSRIVGYERRP